MQLQNDKQASQGELDLKFQLSKETLDTMLKSMYCIKDQLSNLVGFISNFHFNSSYTVVSTNIFLFANINIIFFPG